MNFSALSKTGFAASLLCATLAGWSTVVQAGTLQDTIFAKVESSSVDRMFVRLSYVSAFIKTSSKDAYDVTGPVVARGDVTNFLVDGSYASAFTWDGGTLDYGTAAPLIDGPSGGLVRDSAICASEARGLGTPCGIRAKSEKRVQTAAVSIGYYLEDSKSWVVEALLLGAPVSADVYGDGRNQLNGKKIISTKLLPPILSAGYFFGDSSSYFRPYAGLAASYAVFFDTKAEEALNAYQGGANVGDTTVRISNSFGVGPVVGLKFEPKDSGWHVNLTVGKIRFKADATLTTRNTVIRAESDVLKDYGPFMQRTIVVGNNLYANVGDITVTTAGTPTGYAQDQVVPLTTALMCDLAAAKYGNNDCNHGTFVRKASTTLDNTMVMLSVGRNF